MGLFDRIRENIERDYIEFIVDRIYDFGNGEYMVLAIADSDEDQQLWLIVDVETGKHEEFSPDEDLCRWNEALFSGPIWIR